MPPVQPELTSQQSTVPFDVLAEQLAVFLRRARQEWRSEAGRELGLDAGEALLGPGDLAGVAGEEVELRRRDLAVAVPPHGVFGLRIDDGVLVLGAAADVLAGFGAERTRRHYEVVAEVHWNLTEARVFGHSWAPCSDKA